MTAGFRFAAYRRAPVALGLIIATIPIAFAQPPVAEYPPQAPAANGEFAFGGPEGIHGRKSTDDGNPQGGNPPNVVTQRSLGMPSQPPPGNGHAGPIHGQSIPPNHPAGNRPHRPSLPPPHGDFNFQNFGPQPNPGGFTDPTPAAFSSLPFPRHQDLNQVIESPVFKKILELMQENLDLKSQLKIQAIEARTRIHTFELEAKIEALTEKLRQKEDALQESINTNDSLQRRITEFEHRSRVLEERLASLEPRPIEKDHDD